MRAEATGRPDLGALGKLIRERRRAARLSMVALASQAGVSRSTLHRLEAGSVVPTPRRLARVLHAVDVRPAQAAEVVGREAWGLKVVAALHSEGLVITPERWLRPAQAAEHLGVGLGALPRLKRAGIPFHRMTTNNGLCLFLASELDAWQASHGRRPATPPQPDPRQPRYRPRATAGRPACRMAADEVMA